MNLKSLSVGKLRALREQVDAVLRPKIADQRREIEGQLAKFDRILGAPRNSRGQSGKIAPKFLNPNDPTKTWAGRGLKPRWLTDAIKGGKKLEDFAILGTTTAKTQGSTASRPRQRHK
jgi:DNA-binding protein H-NS